MSREDADSEQSLDRRRALAALGAGGAALGGLGVGSAAAVPEPAPEVDVSEFKSVEAVELAVSENPDVLEELSAEGIIAEPSVEELGIKSLGEPDTPDDATVVVTAQRTPEAVEPKMMIQRERDDGFLHVDVKPESGDAFAVWSTDVGQQVIGCDCDDGCECKTNCSRCNNSAQCPKYPDGSRGYCVNHYCDCGGW